MMLDKIISDLLFEYDCVVIPGFGGFIGNYYPATIISTTHTFFPPSKSLLFNINLKQNDGLLASHYATEAKVSYAEAMEVIQKVVSDWNRQLGRGERIVIDGIGTLFSDIEGNVQYTPSRDVNFLQESFGMASYVSPMIHREKLQRKIEKKINNYLDPTQSQRRALPRSLKWAAMLALPIGAAAFFGITHFDRIKSISGEYAGILFPIQAEQPTSITSKKAVVNQQPKTLTIAPVVPQTQPKRVIEVVTSQKEVLPGDYSIIVGAFKFEENAQKLVAELQGKGYDAALVGQTKSGLHRVQLRSFNSKEEAIQQLAMVRSGQYPGAWLLVK